jgi:hypothetical protein
MPSRTAIAATLATRSPVRQARTDAITASTAAIGAVMPSVTNAPSPNKNAASARSLGFSRRPLAHGQPMRHACHRN